jgi:protein SCO1/2
MRRLALAAVLALLAAPAAPAEDGRPPILRDVGFDQRIGTRLPLDLAFRDQAGRHVRLGAYVGAKPLLLVPAYYECPMLCGLVLNGVLSALRALPFDVGDAFTVVTVSFDPRDDPAAAAAKRRTTLEQYRRPGAEAGWHFLTGEPDAIRRLTEAIGFRYVWDEASRQFAHASGVVVVTPGGVVSHYLYGVEFSPRDLRLALVEASAGRLGSAVDQLLLFCFHYDPVTGRYGRLAMGAVRAGGVVTLLVLAGGIALLLRREAARRRTRARPA